MPSPSKRLIPSARPTRRSALAGAVLATLVASLTALVPSFAVAQDAGAYPTHPVKIIVPFPPGGAADIYARMVGLKLAEAWGNKQPVVIDNKPGAGGIIGTDLTAKSPADGSTFLMVTVGHAVNPYMYAKLPYDTAADLVPVGLVAQVPSLVVVGPGSPSKSLKDLLAAAKAKPGALQFATSGIGTTSHVGAAMLESMSNTDMLHVPYKGAAPALQDVMADRVSMSVDIITSSLPLVKGGKLTALATTGAKRSAKLPDVPTVAEAGVPGYEFVSWYMLVAPAKTPPAIIEKVNAELRKMASAPDFKGRIEETGGEAMAMTTKQTSDYLNAEFKRWSQVVKERNIKAE